MKFENLADSGDLIEVARSGKIVRILGWDQLCWLCSRTNPILGAQHCQQSHPQGIKPRLPSYLPYTLFHPQILPTLPFADSWQLRRKCFYLRQDHTSEDCI